MYHAMPARCGPLLGFSAVSSAPQSLPEAGCCAPSAGLELRKYWVPLFARLNCDVPGDCAGHSVKPGCVEPASLGAFTMPEVSMCCIVTLAAPAASCAFDSA